MKPRYSKREEDYISSIIHKYQPPVVISKVRKWEQLNGYPIRSVDALRHKIMMMGRNADYQEDNFTYTQLARVLDIDPQTVRNWGRTNGLLKRKYPGSRMTIDIIDFRKWARKNTDRLKQVDPDRLNWILTEPLIA